MKFRAHETFFIMKGWLYKGLRNVIADESVFMGTNGNPMDILGIGSSKVKSLRYWLQAVGLTSEPPSGKRFQTPTLLGNVVFDNDPYIEEIGTLWILHYMLAKNEDLATSWYFLFNEFNRSEFSQDEFVKQLNTFIVLRQSSVAERSLDDDFKCIINTYLPRMKSNPSKVHPENNIDCPFGELSLIDFSDKKSKIYKKTTPKIDTINPLVILAVIIDQSKSERTIRISSIQNDKCNAGKIFNLDTITLINLLTKLEIMGYIKVVRTAGLDVITIEEDIDFIGCVTAYYNAING